MKKKYIKLALILSALAGILLLANIPNFSSKVKSGKFWHTDKAEITVNKTIYDFGTIKENDGNVSTTFIITNNSKEPIVLTYVATSCGCTASDWTKGPVESGKTGEVTATFNPLGRIGSFEKTITIYTTGTPKSIAVRIKGMVE